MQGARSAVPAFGVCFPPVEPLSTSPPNALDWLASRARALVPLLVLAHALAWTILPTLTNTSLPLDVIEALAWGREWSMGYDKHPPLSAWAAEIAAVVGQRSDIALYALSQLCVAIGSLAMWRLARDLLDEGRAALSTIALLVGVNYMHFTSPEFNVNVLQIPLWGLLFLCFWRALDRRSIPHWISVGVLFGGAMLTKYLAAFALPPLALFVLLSPAGRRSLRTPGPYLAGVVATLVFLPHFRWMLETDFVTLRYGMARASAGEREILDHLKHPLKFLLAQTFACVFALVPLLAAGGRFSRERAAAPTRFLYLALIALGPVLAMIAYSMLTGARLRSMWGTPMLIAVPALLAACMLFDPRRSRIRPLMTAWAVLFMLAMGAYLLDNSVAPIARNDAKRTNFDGRSLAKNIEAEWSLRNPGVPLPIVLADEWYGGLVSWYGPSRASVYIHADPARTFWLTDDDVLARGGMVVWKIGDEPREGQPSREPDRAYLDDLRARFPDLVELEPFAATPVVRPFRADMRDAGEILGRAYIPPRRPAAGAP